MPAPRNSPACPFQTRDRNGRRSFSAHTEAEAKAAEEEKAKAEEAEEAKEAKAAAEKAKEAEEAKAAEEVAQKALIVKNAELDFQHTKLAKSNVKKDEMGKNTRLMNKTCV